jgi:hypothetical protein
MTICKFVFELTDFQSIKLPAMAKILSVANQHDRLWGQDRPTAVQWQLHT